jgi:tetratricopeptide (TPR) repeat protein
MKNKGIQIILLFLVLIVMSVCVFYYFRTPYSSPINKVTDRIKVNQFHLRIQLQLNGLNSARGIIELTKNKIPFKTIVSEGKVYYPISLDLNANYFFNCSSKGYRTKQFFIDTHVPTGRDQIEFAPFKITVDLERDSIKQCTNLNQAIGGIRYDSIKQDFQKIKRTNDNECNSALEYFEKGNAEADLNKFTEAISFFNQAIKLNPTDPDFYIERGHSKEELKNFTGALKDYTQAIQLDERNEDAYFDKAGLEYELDDLKKALDDYTKVIELNPTDADAYYNRALVKQEKGDKQGACSDWTIAAKLGCKDAEKDKIHFCK